MISKTKIKKKITSSTQSTIYERAYQFECSDGYVLSVVKTEKDQTPEELKSLLISSIQKYLLIEGLEE